MKGKAIGYTRVSTGAQASSGLGIEAQEAEIRRFCTYKDLELVYVYQDPGESGGLMLQKRPSGQVLWDRLRESEDEPWTLHLVASKLDRLWRNVSYMHAELAELEQLKVNVHTAKNGRTLLTGGEDADREAQAYARLFTEFTATIDELERIRASERTQEALAAKKARGEHVGRPPFGYHLDTKLGQLFPDQRELTTLGMIQHFDANRPWSHAEIARDLNKRGRLTKNGRQWTANTVYKQLVRLRKSADLGADAREAFELHLERRARELGTC